MSTVLELFCGLGGWTQAWADCPKNHIIIGTDIKDYGFKHGKFIKSDIKNLNEDSFPKIDFVLTSPPCGKFSNFSFLVQKVHGIKRDPYGKGLNLVYESNRLIEQLKRKNKNIKYVMENVSNMEKYYQVKPSLRFRMNAAGRRTLWSNIKFDELMPFDYRGSFNVRFSRDKNGVQKSNAQRALIPYVFSKYVHYKLCK